MTDAVQLGELYRFSELPDNQMNNSGNLEWVADEYAALVHDNVSYEFYVYDRVEVTDSWELDSDYDDRFYRCVRKVHIDENGEITDREAIDSVPEDP